ncbi:apolipoprotein N-acyltransferase [Endozoicomonas sp. OPT23]|uniref:apolipoprotein N-acyltransferase n=1 Tax=Endozoicomonas sp. OPT23 TaxID=2072845 RepID=UPI00129B0A19|nr:apolipoprotein N-acyltransferase [Endozoicomonas sp. OPT23]MRI32843.1 apolipoprotein N-acyltransferase [Endozoicomonas sp. OPT23]
MPSPKKSPKKVLSFLMPALAGSLATLAFAPYDFWPLLLPITAAFFLLIRTETVKTATLKGLSFGLGMFGTGVSWVYVSIHQFGSAPPILAVLLTALFVLVLSAFLIAPMAYSYSRLRDILKVSTPWRQALLFTGLWVIFEWTRTWLLTGFPWLLQGYALLDTPFQSWAPITGVFGLSFLLALAATAIAAVIVSKQKKPAVFLATVTAALWLAALPLDKVQWTKPVKEISFSAVQGNISQSLKWNPNHIQKTISTYYGLTQSEWQQDLIVWPENALPFFYSDGVRVLEQLGNITKANDSTLILGMPVDDTSSASTSESVSKELRYYNGILSVGATEGRYFKQKLVPFGEYVPLESTLRGLISFFDLPMSAFSKGNHDQKKLSAAGTDITSYICYEVVYPDFAAKQAKGSGLLVTISNDTWFGKSIGPVQHYQMARMRSLETGRYLIRATNDGITALVNEKGQEVTRIERFKEGVLKGKAMVMEGTTPFMNFGSWPVLFLSLLLIFLAAVFTRRQ